METPPKLEPVGQDHDGEFKPLDQLNYGPSPIVRYASLYRSLGSPPLKIPLERFREMMRLGPTVNQVRCAFGLDPLTGAEGERKVVVLKGQEV